MIPLRAQKRGSRRVVATWVIIIVCVGVLVRVATLPAERASGIMLALAVVPARLLSPPWWDGQPFTLLTSCLLHAGWFHLASNMLFLAVFGPAVESRLGWRGLAGLFVASGVVAALAFALSQPESTVPLVGASGAIAAVLGAYVVLDPRARITAVIPAVVSLEIASLPAFFVIGLWFLTQVASSVAAVTPETAQPSVAWTAHIVGFGVGMCAGLVVRLTDRGTPVQRQPTGRRS